MPVRAVRGATTVERDERDHVLERTRELLTRINQANGLASDDYVSVIFTATQDVSSVAPAVAARQIGFEDVALICLQEMQVQGGMSRVVRVLAHVETEKPRGSIANVYLYGTDALRDGVPPVPGNGPSSGVGTGTRDETGEIGPR